MSTFSWTLPSAPSVTNDPGDEINTEFFGTDLYFENNFELTSAGDYMLLYGIEALRAAVYRRLLTRPGEYKFVPEYGVGVQTWIKKRMTPDNIESLKQKIKANLLQDQRIDAVNVVEISKNSDTLVLRISVQANGRELRFVPFQFSEEV